MNKQEQLNNAKAQLEHAFGELQNESPDIQLLHDYISEAIHRLEKLPLPDVVNWTEYSRNVSMSHPEKEDRYFILYPDGTLDDQKWLGNSWEHNNSKVAYWAEINLPEKFKSLR